VTAAISGQPFTPPKLQLDEIVIREGRIRYAEGFQVWPEAIDAESASQEQVIGGLAGISASRIDPMNFHVALTNKRWNSFAGEPSPKTGSEYRHDASVTKVAVGGFLSRSIASIQKAASANPNQAKVRVRHMPSAQDASFSTIPPGAFLDRGERTSAFRVSPQPVRPLCDGKKALAAPDFGNASYEREWINYRRELYHPNGPAPGPDDDMLPLPEPSGDGVPGNCTCDLGCTLPCSDGPWDNPLTSGPVTYGFACSVEKMGETCLYPPPAPAPQPTEAAPTPTALPQETPPAEETVMPEETATPGEAPAPAETPDEPPPLEEEAPADLT
jgi:hypothetical protein